MRAQAFAKRVLPHERLQLPDELGVPAGSDIRLDPILEARKAKLLEAGDLGLGEALERELAERRPAPERERFGVPTLPVQALEALEVELSLVDPEQIAGSLGLHTVFAKLLAQLQNLAEQVFRFGPLAGLHQHGAQIIL